MLCRCKIHSDDLTPDVPDDDVKDDREIRQVGMMWADPHRKPPDLREGDGHLLAQVGIPPTSELTKPAGRGCAEARMPTKTQGRARSASAGDATAWMSELK